ncbi:MAG: hypothetical protein DRP50_08005 [Thermotoga sp.]|nr:MAG: hypothetical protein DRP50_08005 [Thermotoga sp.]
MADNTIIQQGFFTSDGCDKIIKLRSGVDWMEVTNHTQAALHPNPGVGVKYFWQKPMAAGTGNEYKKVNAEHTLTMVGMAAGGFTYRDTTNSPLGDPIATITAISTAAAPVVSANPTTGIEDNCIVRLTNVTNASQLGGMDFTVNNLIADTSFALPFMAQLALAGTNGTFRVIAYENSFYPKKRYISKIAVGVTTTITLTVTHGFTVGQKVRVIVPAIYSTTEINNQTGTVTAIDAGNNTITLDIDSTGYTAFTFPAHADTPFSHALIVPVGESGELDYVNTFDDATLNTDYIGMVLGGGANGPGGVNGDVMYWKAGKSFNM